MMILLRGALCTLLCICVFYINGQSIRINEAVSSKSQFFDEDGDTPDWFELHNTSTNTISLNGWTASDNEGNPTKWNFPAIELAPDEYAYIWASGKDKGVIAYPRTLINRNEFWKYIHPSQPVNLNWIDLSFNDSNWFAGQAGFGYADNDDATVIPTGTPSVFMRRKFLIDNKDNVNELILDIDYDDAFVAYINGEEVARANIDGERPDFNDFSIVDHEAQIYSGGRPDRFVVDSDVLQNGENILSIQAHNISANSSDFTLIPFLSAFFSTATTEGIEPPTILNLLQRTAHTNFKLSAGETLFIFDDNGNEIDKLLIESTPPDISLGLRSSDNNLVLFDPPTPGTENIGNGFEGFVTEEIEFSHPGGIVNNLQLTMSGVVTQNEIRYTLDATIPNSNSQLYNGPISINQTTVLRARIFKNGFIPSQTQSRTYITNATHEIPVVSLVTDPDNLFDNDVGIYELGSNYENNYPFFGSNFWEDWERPINYTLYENDSIGINFDAGIKIFGGWSRAQDQRSFSLFARGKYGTNEIDYPLFPTNDYDTYQALVLRNSGNDFLRSNIRDGVLTTLMDGSGIETQAFRPVATYINGDYWGMYHMREKVNEHFIASRHNVNPDEVDLMGPLGELIHGDDSEYIALQNFLQTNTLESESKYNMVSEQIDIENFIIYNIAQIYFNNTDWPGNNIKYWKAEGGKWRWILYDTDFGFGVWNPESYNSNTINFALDPSGPNWPNPPSSTLMLRRLVNNIKFRNQFINQFADELNSRFLPNNVEEHIENIATLVSPEITNHYNRWGGSVDFHNDQVDVMKNFARLRPAVVKSNIRSRFNLPAFHQLNLQTNNPTRGYIKVNSLTIRIPFWKGDYFENVPIKITAVAKPGYIFSHWTGDNISTDPELIVDMKSAMTFTAIFQESTEEQTVVINEINYNSLESQDAGDWIELYNPSENILDISNWVFTDSSIEEGYTFPVGTIIGGKEFLVVAKDLLKFEIQNPQIENTLGNLNFGLSSNGETLKIYDNNESLVVSVQYDSEDPWSEMANGLGYTLELKSPDLDNSLAENWASIHNGGSPGITNEGTTSLADSDSKSDFKFFPNPFINELNLEFELLNSAEIKIKLYNRDGSFIKSIFKQKLSEGNHRMVRDLDFLNKGVYILEFAKGEKVETYKLIKL